MKEKEFPTPKLSKENLSEKRETAARLQSLLKDGEAAFKAVIDVERAACDTPAGLKAFDNDVQFHSSKKSQLESAERGLKALTVGKKARLKHFGGFEGKEGWNRYEILSDGTIRLSYAHSFQPCIKKAREVGILVQDLHDTEARMAPCPCGSGKSLRDCHGMY